VYIKNSDITFILVLRLSASPEVLHNTCNMGTSDLPDMYARNPRAAPSGFGHTYQANHSCPCCNYKITTLHIFKILFLVIVRNHIPAPSRHKCWVGVVRMMQHRSRSGAEVSMHHSNTSYEAFMPWRGWLWCLTGIGNGNQVVKRASMVGHKFLSTKRLVVESLSDIETSKKLTYHFLFVSRLNKCQALDEQIKMFF